MAAILVLVAIAGTLIAVFLIGSKSNADNNPETLGGNDVSSNNTALQGDWDECFATTLSLVHAQRQRSNLTIPVHAQLCPHSRLRVSYRDDYLWGTGPPLVLQSNMHVTCGLHGHVHDDCVVDGSDGADATVVSVQFPMALEKDPHFRQAAATNVTLEGLTFERGSMIAFLINGGNVTFRNCVFRVRTRKYKKCGTPGH